MAAPASSRGLRQRAALVRLVLVVRRAEPHAVHAARANPGEALAANALMIGGAVVYPREHRATLARLEAAGLDVRPVPAGELAKAEGGVTCCSLLVT